MKERSTEISVTRSALLPGDLVKIVLAATLSSRRHKLHEAYDLAEFLKPGVTALVLAVVNHYDRSAPKWNEVLIVTSSGVVGWACPGFTEHAFPSPFDPHAFSRTFHG